MSSAYGVQLAPQEIFDAILALLSASTYTTRFAHDLEDAFPHVPFPANPDVFREAAALGARIRELQALDAEPDERFRQARLEGRASGSLLGVPPPRRAFEEGAVFLLADRSLRVAGVSNYTWEFAVSGYPVLRRWLQARKGETLDRHLLRTLLDIIARIEELMHLFDTADGMLNAAAGAALTGVQLDLTQ